MSKHTEGPWITNGWAIEHELKSGFSLVIASAYGDVDNTPIPDSEVAANARLIAAAPEMLAALKETAKYWFLFGHEVDVPVGLENQVKQAIAKAEGEENE